jgi:protein SCO1/2
MRRLLVPLVALCIGFAALVVAAVLTLRPAGQETRPSTVGGPFALVSHESKAVTDRDFLGTPYLVFFGFTHCPDVCPTKLFELSEVFRAMGDRGKAVKAMFITVDPERDTPVRLAEYVSSFHPRLIGLTGTPADIRKTALAYKVFFARHVGARDYAVDHTGFVYLVGRDGRFLKYLPPGSTPDEIADAIRSQLGAE